jgi:type VI secretion system protein ImpG
MVDRYYQQELHSLKDLAVDFSKAHPALAPMLSGPGTDPDVERLLEGVAFLTALLRRKLDDEFPELIHDLIRLIWPHYLRPLPSTTQIAFTPKPGLKQSLTIPAGIQVGSTPVEGTSCLFRTAYEVEIHPLSLLEASFQQPSGQPPAIRLLLELEGLKVSDWHPKSLRFYLAGDYPNASDLYLLLRQHLKRIVIAPQDKGTPVVLSPDLLRPVGFSSQDALIPYPSHSYPGYQIIQEYFTCPQKFLYLDLTGWERWQNRGQGSKFEIRFELEDLPFSPPRVRKENFVLFVTPAINIFPLDADPILLDHRKTEYLVRPSGTTPAHYLVYAVDRVVGFIQGTAEERRYVPFELFNPEPQATPVYHLSFRPSPVGRGANVYLSVAYPANGGSPVLETLSISLTCTNGSLPESLRLGDISLPTNTSPEYVEFRNLQPPTPCILLPLGSNLLWRLLSHLSLNYLSLARTENLKALLELYIFPDSRDQAAVMANRKRISGIEKIEAKASDRLVSGILMRGQELQLRMRQDHFAGSGDLFLFGSVLDCFLGGYATINTYTQLHIQEVLKGDRYRWPARIGDHPLI